MLVATEAAGEGINLQFCWLMINFDIPWNPVRLEQRVGRIHRYGQEHDCLIINFVAQNTREGRVLQKLLDRLAEIRKDLGTDQVFDVVGEVFPSNLLEQLLREDVRPADRRAPDSGPHRPRRQPRAVPGDHRVGLGGPGPQGTEPLGHRRHARPRPRNGGWCPRSSSSSSSRPPPRRACIPSRPPRTAMPTAIGKIPRNLCHGRRPAGTPLRASRARIRHGGHSTRPCSPRIRRWNGSRLGIRCSRPSVAMS